MNYNKINDKIIKELIAILGQRNVIYNDKEKLEPYSHDEVSEKQYQAFPDVVVKPETTEQVSKIMKLAYENNIPVTPRGAGSGLSGGAVPVYGGIVLSVEKMNKILEIDKENLTITVEPGVVTNDINVKLKDDNLFYAGYPMSLETCYIGGNVAENAGGGKAIKYGVTSRYVIGLECVLPDGSILNLGGKRVKDVTGYDLIHLLVGSEGTLAIFTKIILKLLPLPKASADLLVLFPDTKSAIGMVPKIMTMSGIIPTAVEYMDKKSFQTACDYLNENIDYQDANAMLLITVDGYDREQVEKDYEKIGFLCEENGALEIFVADNATTSARVWNIRKNIAEAFKVYHEHQSAEDIVVPYANIPNLIPEIVKIADEYNVEIPCFGHAGDGNIHATVLKTDKVKEKEWPEVLEKVLTNVYKKTVELGGTISGEHGIGSKRRKYIKLALSEAEIEIMKKIKNAFDPKHILNPGKIFE